MVTSEWAKPSQFENGLVPQDLLANKYGHQIHFWDLRKRKKDYSDNRHRGRESDASGAKSVHEPTRVYGFAGVEVSTKDLSS